MDFQQTHQTFKRFIHRNYEKRLNTAEHPCSSSHQSPRSCSASKVSEPSPCTPYTPDGAPTSWSASPSHKTIFEESPSYGR